MNRNEESSLSGTALVPSISRHGAWVWVCVSAYVCTHALACVRRRRRAWVGGGALGSRRGQAGRWVLLQRVR